MKLFQDFFRLTKVFYFSAILVKDDVISYTVGGDSDYSMKQLGARRIPTPTGWNISFILSPPPRPPELHQGSREITSGHSYPMVGCSSQKQS